MYHRGDHPRRRGVLSCGTGHGGDPIAHRQSNVITARALAFPRIVSPNPEIHAFATGGVLRPAGAAVTARDAVRSVFASRRMDPASFRGRGVSVGNRLPAECSALLRQMQGAGTTMLFGRTTWRRWRRSATAEFLPAGACAPGRQGGGNPAGLCPERRIASAGHRSAVVPWPHAGASGTGGSDHSQRSTATFSTVFPSSTRHR